MLSKINPTSTNAWRNLQKHYDRNKNAHLLDLFKKDKNRFSTYSINFNNVMLVDYSKNFITDDTLDLLISLANECDLSDSITKLFEGNIINATENRPVLHMALRERSNRPIYVDNINILPNIQSVLSRMKSFSEQVSGGGWLGYSGKPITDVVNIGIGGSDLGPHMIIEALKFYKSPHINTHFVSNIDGSHIAETLKNLQPETTLFLIASKTFSTQETMTNAETARRWFLEKAGGHQHIAKHFAAMSSNLDAVSKFGISENNCFEFWDWVGGRFSWCSAVGLSIACTIGYSNFEKMLDGAYLMDRHFVETPFRYNIPVLLALLGIWYRNFYNCMTEAVLPYDQNLHRFTAYLQQCNMESNGKSVDRSGNEIQYQTGPIVWGEPGTNGQHAFFQLLHQGTQMIPADFLASANSHYKLSDHHEKLLSHFFAQTETLAFGNMNNLNHDAQPFKVLKGNHPTNSILLSSLTPENLGSLVSLYEHKIFVQGVIWNVYSFDQWGVELGKISANKILTELNDSNAVNSHDSSTNGLINTYKKMRN